MKKEKGQDLSLLFFEFSQTENLVAIVVAIVVVTELVIEVEIEI